MFSGAGHPQRKDTGTLVNCSPVTGMPFLRERKTLESGREWRKKRRIDSHGICESHWRLSRRRSAACRGRYPTWYVIFLLPAGCTVGLGGGHCGRCGWISVPGNRLIQSALGDNKGSQKCWWTQVGYRCRTELGQADCLLIKRPLHFR
jgi:hypothetical protein